jgi:hypothetical protein
MLPDGTDTRPTRPTGRLLIRNALDGAVSMKKVKQDKQYNN